MTDEILRQFPITTPNIMQSQVEVILRSIEETEGIPGDVVELGCHAGLTSVYIRRVLDALGSKREFHAYDSFEGLPEKLPEDEAIGPQAAIFKWGHFDLKGTWQIENRFETSNLTPPVIHKGWFKDQEYPEKISFGFLDGDFYSSIKDSLDKVLPRLQSGGILCIHDYKWDQLPGVEKAVAEQLGDLPSPVFGLGVYRKP